MHLAGGLEVRQVALNGQGLPGLGLLGVATGQALAGHVGEQQREVAGGVEGPIHGFGDRQAPGVDAAGFQPGAGHVDGAIAAIVAGDLGHHLLGASLVAEGCFQGPVEGVAGIAGDGDRATGSGRGGSGLGADDVEHHSVEGLARADVGLGGGIAQAGGQAGAHDVALALEGSAVEGLGLSRRRDHSHRGRGRSRSGGRLGGTLNLGGRITSGLELVVIHGGREIRGLLIRGLAFDGAGVSPHHHQRQLSDRPARDPQGIRTGRAFDLQRLRRHGEPGRAIAQTRQGLGLCLRRPIHLHPTNQAWHPIDRLQLHVREHAPHSISGAGMIEHAGDGPRWPFDCIPVMHQDVTIADVRFTGDHHRCRAGGLIPGRCGRQRHAVDCWCCCRRHGPVITWSHSSQGLHYLQARELGPLLEHLLGQQPGPRAQD